MRSIIALILTVVWAVSVGHCMLECIHLDEGQLATSHHHHHGDHQHNHPQQDSNHSNEEPEQCELLALKPDLGRLENLKSAPESSPILFLAYAFAVLPSHRQIEKFSTSNVDNDHDSQSKLLLLSLNLAANAPPLAI